MSFNLPSGQTLLTNDLQSVLKPRFYRSVVTAAIAGTMLFSLPLTKSSIAQETATNEAAEATTDANANAEATSESIPAGHSYHGEAFNEGPRQAAVLMEGMGKVDFPSSAKKEQTRNFINQGIAALHGFWYLEAERSFRQAAQLEPDLAICYWGMAEANTNNLDRARKFIKQAMERKEQASQREKMLIEATDEFLKPVEGEDSADRRKGRWQAYFKSLEKIIYEFPDDIEAKAWLAVQMWKGAGDLPITSHVAVDALLDHVFTANPMHPAHHYRIHLWDGERPESALRSAALCGPSLPGIAHMWHMPGHTYSRLKRYHDAIYQQEASARVDHAHMIRTRLMPDEIHNFSHNNEWLTRNLIFVGRVNDALQQSRNLVAMPQHPKYNTPDSRGSFRYGRTRLLQTLTEYELWQALVDEANTVYLAPTNDVPMQEERLAWLAVAHYFLNQPKEARKLQRELQQRNLDFQQQQLDLEAQLDALDEKASEKPADSADSAATEGAEEKPTKESLEKQIRDASEGSKRIRKEIALVDAAKAVIDKDVAKLEKQFGEGADVEETLKASWFLQAGAVDKAIEQLNGLVDRDKHQVRPLAILVHALNTAKREEDAKKRFEELRTVAGHADLETPLLARLRPLADAAGLDADWRTPPAPAEDLGPRPDLASLGPVHWSPYVAPNFSALNEQGDPVTEDDFQGQPRIVVFYLGFGCVHCVEQLKALAPVTQQFADAGIKIVGISTENIAELRKGIERYEEQLPFPLLSDGEHLAFKQYRCWDDFESQPLHGTFLIDAAGRVRWQDIGHEPFTDVEFLLEESKRLLALPDSL